MKHKILLPSCLLLMASFAFSQSISLSVIALAGGYEKTPSGISVSWTIGEPVVDPLKSDNAILTQGFQQPHLTLSTAYEDPSFDYRLTIFPNPVSGELIMQTDFKKQVDFKLIDLSGKLIKEGSWSNNNALDVSDLSPGIYAIYFTTEGRMVKSDLVNKH